MSILSKNVENELMKILEKKDELIFVVDGKLISIEVENQVTTNKSKETLAEQIENYPELKASLNRYVANPDMARFTNADLKRMRHARSQ